MNSIFDMKPPFLKDGMIEFQANALIRSYEGIHGTIDTLHTPVEDILERTLGLTLEVDDFTRGQYFGEVGDDVLGFIAIKDKAIFINQNIDPLHNSTALQGRFFFTLAHEVGHYVLHKELFTEYHAQQDFFGHEEQQRPAILCRHPDDDTTPMRPFIEQHADKFASYLLMPAQRVTLAMHQHFGGDTPLTFADLDNMGGMYKALAPMAEDLKVSIKALRIRMEKMNLLSDGTQPCLL